jgi:hypothetical protein
MTIIAITSNKGGRYTMIKWLIKCAEILAVCDKAYVAK